MASVDKVVSSLICFLSRGHAQDLGHTIHICKPEFHTLLADLDMGLGSGIVSFSIVSEAYYNHETTNTAQKIKQQLRIENRKEKHQLIQEEEFVKRINLMSL